MTEFALVAPIFFLLLFAIIEMGIMFGGQNGLVAATRELARYAAPFRVATEADAIAVCANKADADHGLTQQLSGFMSRAIPGYSAANSVINDPRPFASADRTIKYSWHPNPPPAVVGEPQTYYVELQVRVRYHFPLYVPLVGNLIDGFDGVKVGNPPRDDGKFLMEATEHMRIENLGLTSTFPDVTCNI